MARTVAGMATAPLDEARCVDQFVDVNGVTLRRRGPGSPVVRSRSPESMNEDLREGLRSKSRAVGCDPFGLLGLFLTEQSCAL